MNRFAQAVDHYHLRLFSQGEETGHSGPRIGDIIIGGRVSPEQLSLWCGGLAVLSVYEAGGGHLVCGLAGFTAATATIITGQLLGGFSHSPLNRACAGLAFAIPAAIAGYHAAHGSAAAFGINGGIKAMIAISMSVLAGRFSHISAPVRQNRAE